MSKYRIVRIKGYDSLYRVDKKGWFFWQIEPFGSQFTSIAKAEGFINDEIADIQRRAANPKDVIIKEYHV
jgi:hypothetical protein